MRMLIKEVSEAQAEVLFDEMLRATNQGALITPITPAVGVIGDYEAAEEDFEEVTEPWVEISEQQAISHLLAKAENLEYWSCLFRKFTEDGWNIALMRENTRVEWAKILRGLTADPHEEVVNYHHPGSN